MRNEALVLDLLEWLGGAPRPYDEVLEAWRTSCPRLTVREDALDAGLVEVRRERALTVVAATPSGARSRGREAPPSSRSSKA